MPLDLTGKCEPQKWSGEKEELRDRGGDRQVSWGGRLAPVAYLQPFDRFTHPERKDEHPVILEVGDEEKSGRRSGGNHPVPRLCVAVLDGNPRPRFISPKNPENGRERVSQPCEADEGERGVGTPIGTVRKNQHGDTRSATSRHRDAEQQH